MAWKIPQKICIRRVKEKLGLPEKSDRINVAQKIGWKTPAGQPPLTTEDCPTWRAYAYMLGIPGARAKQTQKNGGNDAKITVWKQ
ncbi:MAG: hypothetical protein ABFD76_11565 [Smithella sp.]